MLHTIEVEIDAEGIIHPMQAMPPEAERRALLTLVIPDDAAMKAMKAMKATTAADGDWRKFVGALSESPNFNSDGVVIQQELRDEWQ